MPTAKTGRGGLASLGPEHVPLVRRWLLSGVSKAEVAARFGVHRNTIGRFCKRYDVCPTQDFSAINDTPENRETGKRIAQAYARKLSGRLLDEGVKKGEIEEMRSRLFMVVERAMRTFDPSRGAKFSTYLVAGFQNAYRDYRKELKHHAELEGRLKELIPSPVSPRHTAWLCLLVEAESSAGLEDLLIQMVVPMIQQAKNRARRVTRCSNCGAVIVAGSRPPNLDRRKCPFCFVGEPRQVQVFI